MTGFEKQCWSQDLVDLIVGDLGFGNGNEKWGYLLSMEGGGF
jgi:hypothetical protein